MIYINDKISISPEQTRNILQNYTDTNGIIVDLDRALDHLTRLKVDFHKALVPWRKLAGDPYLEYTKRTDVANTLVSRFGVPKRLIIDEKTNKIATNADTISSILQYEKLSEDAKEFLGMYQVLADKGYGISYLNQYTQLPLINNLTFENHRAVVARPKWNVLNTGRLSAEDPSAQNIDKRFCDIISHLKGQLLVRADSGQIEPRITYSRYVRDELLKYLIELYNDAYFGILHFIFLSREEESFARNNLESVKKKEMDESNRSKLKTMILAGGYGGNLDKYDQTIAGLYTEKIVKHPLRIKFQRDIEEMVNRGVETFQAEFGYKITPKETQRWRKSDPQGWKQHLIRCGINNPIQATAGELMCQSVYEATKIIQKKAIGNTYIGYYKHDEGAFYVDEKDSKIVDDLVGCLSYQVKDWIPIYSDRNIGIKLPK